MVKSVVPTCNVHANIDPECSRCMARVKYASPAAQYGLALSTSAKYRSKRGFIPCTAHLEHNETCHTCKRWNFFWHWSLRKFRQKQEMKAARLASFMEHDAKRIARAQLLAKQIAEEAEIRKAARRNNVTTLSLGQAGYVYLVVNPAFPGWVKAGSTVNIEQRLATYQTGDPARGYGLVVRSPATDRLRAEAALHLALAETTSDRRNEWFKIDTALARAVLAKVMKKERTRGVKNVDTPNRDRYIGGSSF